MGNVVYFDFKNKKPIERISLPESQTNVVPIMSKKEMHTKVKKETKYHTAFVRLLLCKDTEDLMSTPVSPNSLEESRKVTKNYVTEELITWLGDTDKKVWKEKAPFFQAIFQELKQRLKLN